MTHWFAIATGGALGAVLRYASSQQLSGWLGKSFPWATLGINVIGSLCMGLLFVLLVERAGLSSEWRAFLMVGLLGAFTTFSTFSIETLVLIEQGDWARALAYVLSSVLVCVLAAAAGVSLARQFL